MMDTSMLLAKIWGTAFIIVSIGFVFNMKTYRKMIEDFQNNMALVYLGGVFSLVIGLLIIHFHNVWEMQWVVIITILGWISLIKGTTLIIFPTQLMRISNFYQKNTAPLIINLLIIFVLGVFLTVKGYMG